jgi:hypothetical protein
VIFGVEFSYQESSVYRRRLLPADPMRRTRVYGLKRHIHLLRHKLAPCFLLLPMRINACGAFLYFCVVHATNRCLAKAAKPNDIVIVSRSINGLPLDRDLIEAMLFTSGWPALAPNGSKLCASSPMLQKVSPALIWRLTLRDIART